MDFPRLVNLGDFTITTAGTVAGPWVHDLDGLLAAALSMRLAYGAGGTGIKAYLQTSLDGGIVPIDIASLTFATAAAHRCLNFSALTPKLVAVTPTDAGLADDTAIDGLLGNCFRVKVVSTGAYTGSTILSCRLTVR